MSLCAHPTYSAEATTETTDLLALPLVEASSSWYVKGIHKAKRGCPHHATTQGGAT